MDDAEHQNRRASDRPPSVNEIIMAGVQKILQGGVLAIICVMALYGLYDVHTRCLPELDARHSAAEQLLADRFDRAMEKFEAANAKTSEQISRLVGEISADREAFREAVRRLSEAK